jgi:hypothetical protein
MAGGNRDTNAALAFHAATRYAARRRAHGLIADGKSVAGSQ